MKLRDKVGMAVVCASVLVGSSRADAQETDWAVELADCIVTHESHWDPSAYNRRSGAAGLGQFILSTWRTTPYANYSRYDPYANHAAVVWMIRHGRAREFETLYLCV